MKWIENSANYLAWSVSNNAALGVIVVAFYYLAFSFIEAAFEKLVFGEAFAHFLDIPIIIFFIYYSSVVVHRCAVNNFNAVQ